VLLLLLLLWCAHTPFLFHILLLSLHYSCVNHGNCKADPLEGCECLAGYVGFKCEFRIENLEFGDDEQQQTEQDNHDTFPQEHQVQDCGDDLVCFHVGKCISSSDSYQCDCDSAVAGGNRYDGPRCQYQSTDFCDDPYLVGLLNVPFCVNGGICTTQDNNDIDNDNDTCDCPNGWTGCEIHQPKDPASAVCGSNLHCLNGGECVQTQVLATGGGDGTSGYHLQPHCDCSTVNNDKFLYAGTSCQHQSTSLCGTHSTEASSSTLFCTNRGTCHSNEDSTSSAAAVYQGCDCIGAFTGFSCEFEADVDEYYKDAKDKEDLEQCGEHVCHNGGTCVTTIVSMPNDQDDGSVSSLEIKHCDCQTAVTEENLFAGDSCQYPSTTFCTTQPER
jgi:hypothetical protein